ncbi:MAG: FMN-binding protein [Bacteroidia bacterium]|nr:FMN-binding protein [Bacteroidia bacterium]
MGKLDKKIHREIEKTFDISQYKLEPLDIPIKLNSELPLSMQKGFRKIISSEDLFGYVFVGSAPSKTAKFDYLVLFDTKIQVVHTKVLIYREEYGGEIGSKRWLRQFHGMDGTNRVLANTNIDAISGATISVRSMTRAMDNLFQSVGMLKKNGIL